jgi:hypothetical protein
MHDLPAVRGFERIRDLTRDRQSLIRWYRPVSNAIGECRSFDELHHDDHLAADLFDPVDLRDVRMIERGQYLGLALEARQPISVVRERVGQDFYGDVALERRSPGFYSKSSAW